MSYRIWAQDALTREFLDSEVPLIDVTVTHTLNGAGEISGAFDPEIPRVNLPTFDAWRTLLHVEQDGLIRQSGLITPYSLDDVSLEIVASGFSHYAQGLPFRGDYVQTDIDPLDVVRFLWSSLQGHANGDLGVSLDSTTSPVRLGTAEEPYTLSWWDAPDIGQEIDSLSDETPFDYAEAPAWNADKSGIDLHIRLGYPRLGTRRDNLRFSAHENIIEPVPFTELGDLYASDVVVLGAGEGRDRINAWSEELGNRLRRVAVIDDKSITSFRRAQQRARDELSRRQNLVAFEEIVVDLTHSNSRLGSFQVGDDIPVTGDFPWVGRHTVYHRITQFSYPLDSDRATLKLIPTDTIRYAA